jgi:tRNA-dependent cyclodipeptide synthase
MHIAEVRIFPESRSLHRVSGEKALIGISLKNYVSRSPLALKQIFEWTHQHCGAFDLLLGDYMNRHNYQMFCAESEAEAEEHAIRDGRHAAKAIGSVLFGGCFNGAKIIQAHTFYNDQTFAARLRRLERVYAENATFKERIHQAIGAFLARHGDFRMDPVSTRHCVAYQLEEIAIFELLAESGYDYLVYAGAQLPIMKSIVRGDIDATSHALKDLRLVEITLSRTQ